MKLAVKGRTRVETLTRRAVLELRFSG
jgi:hypothetical protein